MKIVIAIILILFLVACGDKEPATISKEEYNQLEKGMTYEKVQNIIGGPAENENVIEKDYITEFDYQGEDGVEADSSASLIFINGTLDTKVESGLLTKIEESDKELLTGIHYEVIREENDSTYGTKRIRVKLPDSEKYLYNFNSNDVVQYIYDLYKDDGLNAIYIWVFDSSEKNMIIAKRGAYNEQGLKMTDTEEIGQLVNID